MAPRLQRSAQRVHSYRREAAEVPGGFVLAGLYGQGGRGTRGCNPWISCLCGWDWSGDETGCSQWESVVEGGFAGCATGFERQQAADRFVGRKCEVLQDLLRRLPRGNQKSSFRAHRRG